MTLSFATSSHRRWPACGATSLLAAVLVAAAGCAPDGTATPSAVVSPALSVNAVASVTVTPTADTINAVGFTTQLTATARDGAGNPIPGVTFAWKSANPGRATVDQSGKVTSVARGWARIVATAAGKSDTGFVFSRQVVASVSVSPVAAIVPAGGTVQLAATAKDSNQVAIPNATFNWTSSQPLVASVTSSGLVTGVAVGSASIRAATSGRRGTASVTVTSGGGSGVWKLVHGGSSHTCGITTTGSAQCWGSGGYGQLGTGSVNYSATPLKVAGGHVFTTLWAGDRTNCAVEVSGAGWCWGTDAFGSAGNGRDPGNFCHPYPDESCDNGPDQFAPVPVAGGLTFTQTTVGFHHSCALTPAGQAWCWGANANGQLGTSATAGLTGRCTDFAFGFFPCSDAPVAVLGGLTFKQIANGFWHTCAVTPAGKAYCWGANPAGQLGDGTQTERHTPTPVAGNLTFASVSAMFEHTCGVTTSGEAYCWGQGQNGRLGNGSHNLSTVPKKVVGLPPVESVTAGGYHSCAVATTGAAYCWGWNNFGYVGDGTTTMRLTAVPVSGGRTWEMVEAGYQHTCGVTTPGDAFCWGYNGAGALGDGTTNDRFVPTRVKPPQP
jgi:alpha-tubulin suppressor-like RCC1 family protein